MIVPLLAFIFLTAVPDAPLNNALLDEGYRAMYNLAFNDAHRSFQQFERTSPENPIGPVSDAAAYLFFEFDRLKILRSDFFVTDKTFLNSAKLKPDPQVRKSFEADLQASKQLSDAILRRSPNDQTALFAMVVRIALHADYEALIDKQYWQSLKEIKESKGDADNLLARYPDCYDAYLAAGVENYLLSQKAAPLRWVLKMTGAEADKQTGLAKLRIVADKGHYLKPYARVLLAIAALRDGNRFEAKQIISELARQFPNNDLFQDELKKL